MRGSGPETIVPILSIEWVEENDCKTWTRKLDRRRRCPTINVTHNGTLTKALVDTGAEISIVSEEYVMSLEERNKVEIPTFPLSRTYITGVNQKRIGPIKKQVMLTLNIGDKEYECVFLVVKGIVYDIILGLDFLVEYEGFIDLKNNIIVLKSPIKLNYDENDNEEVESYEPEEYEMCCIEEGRVDREIEEKINSNPIMETGQKQGLISLLVEYREIFQGNKRPITDFEFSIKLNDETPFRQKNYPIPIAYREQVSKQIAQMESDGIIRRMSTPYCSPLMVVMKKSGELRICLDARRLNSVTIPDRDQPPKVEEILQRFKGVLWFTHMDLKAAYWQMAIKKCDQKYTGFLYEGVSFVFQRVPFGLKNSGSGLISCLASRLPRDLYSKMTVFVDDIVLFTGSWEEHLTTLKTFFDVARKNNICLNLEKSLFGIDKINFVGYEVSREGTRIRNETIEQIDRIQAPKNKKQLRSLLGTCNYYARFCPSYALTWAPLLPLLRKDVRFKWNQTYDKAFNDIKAMFHRTCCITYPDYEREIILQVDSSDLAIAGILTQEFESGMKVIAIASRVLKGPELRYSVYEKEGNAIVWSLSRLNEYLLGREFTILTDHKALTFLSRCHLNNERLRRWTLWIQRFNFKVKYCPGKENFLPDLLSRTAIKKEPPRSTEFQVTALDLGIHRMPHLNWEDVATWQENDIAIEPVKLFFEGRLDPDTPAYRRIQIKRALYKMYEGVVLFRIHEEPEVWRIWVPAALTERVVWYVHTKIGHYGAKKTTVVIREVCYWTNMHRHIRQLLSTCMTCLKNKHPNRKYQGEYKEIIAEDKNDLVSVDLFGPLPVAAHKYKYVFVAIDVFSKFTRVAPIRKTNAASCLKRLAEYIQIAGPYRRVLSDHGTMFTGERWKSSLQSEGMTPIFSSIRHPQSNPVERVMKEIARLFRTYCHQEHYKWVELIPQINIWINHIPHESTGVSAREAHFGVRPPHVLEVFDREDALGERTVVPAERIRQRLVEAGVSRRERAKFQRYEFREGQSVLLRVPRLSDPKLRHYGKFFPLFEGPFRIRRIPTANVAELMRSDGSVLGTYNFYNLRPA